MSGRVADVVRGRREQGSAPAEFVLVGVLLTVLLLGVLEVGAVLLVRNTALDAAAEGARWAAMAGNTDADGVGRTRRILASALGETTAREVRAGSAAWLGQPATSVTVRTPLPGIGLLVPAAALEVTAHAVREPSS
jgi:Flp pilus assembly protein TadG